jgi:hypothetical protein
VDQDEHAAQNEPVAQNEPAGQEALVGLALAVGLGVFAVPFDISIGARAIAGAIAFILIVYVFAKFPQLAKLLVKVCLVGGPIALVMLAAALVVIAVKPSLRPPAVAMPPIQAAIAVIVVTALITAAYAFRARGNDLLYWWKFLATAPLIYGAIGAMGCWLFNQSPTGFDDTSTSPDHAGLVGLGAVCIYRQLMRVVTVLESDGPGGSRAKSSGAQWTRNRYP